MMLSPLVSWFLLLAVAIAVLWANYAWEHIRDLDVPELQREVREREHVRLLHPPYDWEADPDMAEWDRELSE